MEFTLIYKGPLPAQGSGGGGGRTREKHAIRRQLHRQLRELWTQHPALKWYFRWDALSYPGEPPFQPIEEIANRYQKFGHRFVPLITESWGLACALDILFLRRDEPGHLVHSGGDIDNRIKVFFDGLHIPTNQSDVDKEPPPTADENPFFCLMEDDRQIVDFRVNTERLLLPIEQEEAVNDVMLVIRVTPRILNSNKLPPAF